METIKQENMINKILHIQTTYSHLPISRTALIKRNIISLRAMTTPALSAYLYGARELVEKFRQQGNREKQAKERSNNSFSRTTEIAIITATKNRSTIHHNT
jgi:hypothetical protein